MTTVFSRIIAGELPARFVWSDDRAVAFLSANPLGPGHTLVVPREEVDQWVDAAPDLFGHLTTVAHAIGVRDRGRHHRCRGAAVAFAGRAPGSPATPTATNPEHRDDCSSWTDDSCTHDPAAAGKRGPDAAVAG